MAPLRIALIDDEECVRKSVSRLLRSAGMEVKVFASGQEFVLASDSAFDCLVLDVHMPRMDGFAVYEHFLRAGIRIPAVVITGHESPGDRVRGDSLGITSYLRKPIDGDELLGSIAEAVGNG
jgi:two-component system response regulator FixJ